MNRDDVCRHIVSYLPSRVIYWCLIYAWAHTTGKPWQEDNSTIIRMEEVLRRWNSSRVIKHSKGCDKYCDLQFDHPKGLYHGRAPL